MKTNKTRIYEYILHSHQSNKEAQHTAHVIAEQLSINRANTSRYLNELVTEGKLIKSETRPVNFRLVTENPNDPFNRLIGFDDSQKQQVQLAKAAILYPEKPLATLLKGPVGSGKGYFAECMFDYLKQNKRIHEDAKFRVINVNDYKNQEEFEIDLYDESKGLIATLSDTKSTLFLIKNIDSLNVRGREQLFDAIDAGVTIIATLNSDTSLSFQKTIESKFAVTVTFPALENRPMHERFELVKKFLNTEAGRMRKKLELNAELLRCLLLYNPEQNISQLKKDIKLGCANAYVRNSGGNEALKLYLSDFPTYIRKGFLYYKEKRESVEAIIPDNDAYTFSSESMELSKSQDVSHVDSIYNIVDKKVEALKKQGLNASEIELLVNEDLEKEFMKLNKRVIQDTFDTSSLSKIVDKEIVASVEEFLNEASKKLNRIFPKSVFYGLNLHLKSALSNERKNMPDLSENISDIIRKYPQEYVLSERFIAKLNNKFNANLPLEEIVFISMFISKSLDLENEQKPIVVIAMHGNHVASAVVEVVKALVGGDNFYAFDLKLDVSISDSYEKLKLLILEKHQNKGVLLIYDMGSIKTMAETIVDETSIEVKTLAVPLTLIALNAVRKATSANLNDLYTMISESYRDNVINLRDQYVQEIQKRTIVTLCMTGEGSAVQIKNYLYENLTMDNVEIVPLAISDKNRLIQKLNRLNQESEVIAIIGTYNPDLFNIPFIPISKIFDTPADKLELLLTFSDHVSISNVDYEGIYSYLSEQLEDFDIETLKEALPQTMRKIKKSAKGLKLDQELGLFMHIATNIYRLQHDESSLQNARMNILINNNKTLYHDVKDSLTLIEREFAIKFTDNDIANIIGIIKEAV